MLGEVSGLYWRQCASKVGRGITFGPPGRHGVAEHLAAVLMGAVGGIEGAALLDPPKARQKLRRRDLPNWPRADPGKQIQLYPPNHLLGMARRPVHRELGEPLAGDRFEGFGG